METKIYDDFYNKNILNIKLLINNGTEITQISEYINNIIEKDIDIFLKKMDETNSNCQTSQKSTLKNIFGNISEI